MSGPSGAEARRLREDASRSRNWKRWGPYLPARQWGTVREDYSPDGSCWSYLPHDHARSRAYRWGEDGLLGVCDRQCRLCFAIALWNHRDPILKERLFGLTGPEGNHGEDVKEEYFFLASTPTHSFMRALYKYPQAEFPYARLVEESRRRGLGAPEFELADTGIFEGSRYFDVLVEYAKDDPEDLLIKVTITNRGPEDADLTLLPTVWFRNTWSWGCTHEGCEPKPVAREGGPRRIIADHASLGRMVLDLDATPGVTPELMFTENQTNHWRLGGLAKGPSKDAFHEAVIRGDRSLLSPGPRGTKAAWALRWRIPPGATRTARLRLWRGPETASPRFGEEFDRTVAAREAEWVDHVGEVCPCATPEGTNIARQAYAGLLWSKQFYHYAVRPWLDGDPAQPPPPASRKAGRNADWPHLFNRDVISVPDTWEYPWYAAWDLAFHMIPMARIDPDFAKEQLVLFLREWYMHPSGQLPAYEFALGDVNPPVHAWAVWRVYKMTGKRGERDREFLERCFHKLLLNFTWWVNRKDPLGKNLFAGGFLGLDNIGVFDRNRPLPGGGVLAQADGTAWMAFFCGTMLSMALELARENRVYEDSASKFFEHFVAIADAMNSLGGTGLWNQEDGFYYDQLLRDHETIPLRLRSMVGLIPLLAVEVLDEDTLDMSPGFSKRMAWFLENRKDLAGQISYLCDDDANLPHGHRLLAIPSRDRLVSVLRYVLDEREFLSPFGVRSLSRAYAEAPYQITLGGESFRVEYAPGESTTSMFGGNSNWRGPVWWPINFLLIEALERYQYFYHDSLRVECPTGSGARMNLGQVAHELRRRMVSLFLPGAGQRRPCHGPDHRFAQDPHWRDLVLFHEFFHGDTGRGLGASHQTGWTALVTTMLPEVARPR